MTKKKPPQKNENNDSPIETEDREPLTPEDEAMVNAYFSEGMNQTRAYMFVHNTDPKNYVSARTLASRVFAKVNIKAEINRRLDENAMSVNEALSRKASIARADLLPFVRFSEDGFIYFDFSHPEAKAHMHIIKKYKGKRERRVDDDESVWEGEWMEVELHDANSALNDILKMHGKFTDKVDLTNSDGSLQGASPEQVIQRVSQLMELANKRKANDKS